MPRTMHVAYLLLMILLFCGSLLSLSSHPHWFVRAWDFPRVQIVVIAMGILLAHLATSHWIARSSAAMSWPITIIAATLVVWHVSRILPYTELTTPQAKACQPTGRKTSSLDDLRLRVMVSNIELENDAYDKWRRTVQDARPDVVIALEPDQAWVKEATPLFEEFPHRVIQPQDISARSRFSFVAFHRRLH